jgi:hypothetical protein
MEKIMFKKKIKLIFAMVFMLSMILPCMAQISETEAKKLAESNQCLTSLTSNKSAYLRFIRDEEIEDYLFELQEKDYKNLIKGTYIFRVDASHPQEITKK